MLADTHPRPRKKPRILPGEEIDEKSKKVCHFLSYHPLIYLIVVFIFIMVLFILSAAILLQFRRQLQSVIVDGNNIMAAAREACQRSLARYEAKEAAAKAAAKQEEERVFELKKVRGEKWLPSIAREMQVSSIKWAL